MIKRPLAAILVTFVLLANFAAGQSGPAATAKEEDPSISLAEKSEARDFMNRYCARLAETNSVAPLLDEFHTADFVEQFSRETLADITPDASQDEKDEASIQAQALLNEMDPATWRRFASDTFDFVYLMMVSSWIQEGNGDETKFLDGISTRATEIFNSNPHLANILDDTTGNNQAFATRKEIEDFLDTLEAGATVMREDIQGHASPLFAKVQSTGFEAEADDRRIQLWMSDTEEYGRPAGTRFIRVDLPLPFTLVLVREGERLKLVALQLRDDD